MPDSITDPDGAVAARLATIEARLDGVISNQGALQKSMGQLEQSMGTRLDKLETAELVRVTLEAERTRTAHESQTTLRWTIGMAFVGAGLVSGIAFGVVNNFTGR